MLLYDLFIVSFFVPVTFANYLPQFCFISQYCADDVGVAAGLFFSCLAKNIQIQSDCWLHSRSCRCSTSCCKVSYSILRQFKDLLLVLVIFNVVGFLYQLLWRICYTSLKGSTGSHLDMVLFRLYNAYKLLMVCMLLYHVIDNVKEYIR